MSSSRLTFFILVFIILYSTLQFFLLLRHKSPYLSDSYFYKHIAYQFEGDTYVQAKEKIKSQIDYTKQDKITLNIFLSDKAYGNSFGYFEKRPLYPYIIFVFNKIFKNEDLAMLLPVFLPYLGTIIIFFVFASKGLNKFFAFFAVFTFVSFYPFLDWSTYYLTDTIGAFFWMSQLLALYKFVNKGDKKWLIIFVLSLLVSLLNREQSMLMWLVTVSVYTILKIKKDEKYKKHSQQVFFLTTIIALIYIAQAHVFNQKNILDTIIYTMNSYGLYDRNFTLHEIVSYLLSSYKSSHVHFVKDLASHHLWATVLASAFFGFIMSLKKFRLMDLIMICSGVASYSAIYLYPVLSYRYFFPATMTICYFSAIFLAAFLKLSQLTEKKSQ